MTTIQQLVDAVRHVPVDIHDTWDIMTKPITRHVLVTRIEAYAAAVGVSNHRIALATSHHSSIGQTPKLISAITGEPVKRSESDPANWPPWREAMDKVRGPAAYGVELDRRHLLGELAAVAVRIEQMASIEAATEKDPNLDCPCDSPGRDLLRDAAVRLVGLRVVSDNVEVDPLLEVPGDDVYGINWWYLVQALTYARSNQVLLTLRPTPQATEVWSEGDGVALTSIMMPVELSPKSTVDKEH